MINTNSRPQDAGISPAVGNLVHGDRTHFDRLTSNLLCPEMIIERSRWIAGKHPDEHACPPRTGEPIRTGAQECAADPLALIRPEDVEGIHFTMKRRIAV